MLRAIAAVALVTAVVAGCGSVPEEPEQASSTDVRTVRFASTSEVQIDHPGWGEPIRTTIEGVVDFVGGDFRLADVEGDERSFVIGIDGITYSRWGSELLPPGKTWVREGGEPTDEPLAAQTAFGLDPRAVLDHASEVYGPLREVGRERVDGVETTHFHAKTEGLGTGVGTSQRMHSFEVDSACADYGAATGLDDTDSSDGTGTTLGLVESPTALPTTFEITQEIDVWVDDEGFTRRVVSSHSGWYRKKETLRFYDFGVPVEVVPPSPDEVIDGDEAWAWMEDEASTACAAG